LTKGYEKKPKVDVISVSKMRENKLAKGCLKIKFWASETMRQTKLLILYPQPEGWRTGKDKKQKSEKERN
jgi:hypothetical protein